MVAVCHSSTTDEFDTCVQCLSHEPLESSAYIGICSFGRMNGEVKKWSVQESFHIHAATLSYQAKLIELLVVSDVVEANGIREGGMP